MEDFSGAKLVLLIGGRLLTILRDNDPRIVHPGMWDLPGGGREPGESPEETVLRETREEVSLSLPRTALVWKRRYENPDAPGMYFWWFAARMPGAEEGRIMLGDEGQRWALVPPTEWLADPRAIASFKPRLRDALAALGADRP